MRIASLLPSATEIVCAIGLQDELVAVTHECDWPPAVIGKPVVTRSVNDLADVSSRDIHDRVTASMHGGSSLYELDEEALAATAPDLILTQELCHVCAVIYRERLSAVEQRVTRRRDGGRAPLRVVAVEWLDPPFSVGHWVPEQIRRAGGWDLLGADGAKARQIMWDEVLEVDPEMLFLMPCGYHLTETVEDWARTPRPTWFDDLPAARRGAVFAVDGSSYFSRPGPRVIDGIELLAEIMDPDGFVDVATASGWTPVD